MVNVYEFRTLFSFCSQIHVNDGFRAGIHKMLVRIANREDPDQTASEEAVCSGSALFSRPFWQATSVQNFRTFSIIRFLQLFQKQSDLGLPCLSRPFLAGNKCS